MISLSTPESQLGAAFGVHRALDTTGAMLGPLVAFAHAGARPAGVQLDLPRQLLPRARSALGILVLFVGAARRGARRRRAGAAAVTARGGRPGADPRYRALLIAGGALSLATVSDAFIFLALRAGWTSATRCSRCCSSAAPAPYMLLAVPMGRLADRVGPWPCVARRLRACCRRLRALLLPIGRLADRSSLALGLLGGYYAATDGVLMALASAVVPEELRGSGLALVRTVTSVARLVASVAFGALWTVWGSTSRSPASAPRSSAAPLPRRVLAPPEPAVLPRTRRRASSPCSSAAASWSSWSAVLAGIPAEPHRAAQKRAASALGRPLSRAPAEGRLPRARVTARTRGRVRTRSAGAQASGRTSRCAATGSISPRAPGCAWLAGRLRLRLPGQGLRDEPRRATRARLAGVPSRARVSPDGRLRGGNDVRHRPFVRRVEPSRPQTTLIDLRLVARSPIWRSSPSPTTAAT